MNRLQLSGINASVSFRPNRIISRVYLSDRDFFASIVVISFLFKCFYTIGHFFPHVRTLASCGLAEVGKQST